MEKLKCDCSLHSLFALNIIDLEKRCKSYLSHKAPNFRLAFVSLEQLIQKCKTKTDRNGIEYEIIRDVFCFLKELPLRLVLETDQMSFISRDRYLYLKEKLSNVLKGDLLSEYIHLVNVQLNNVLPQVEVEVMLEKFLKVCSILHPSIDLSDENVTHYELMVELLIVCCKNDIKISQLVVSLLRMVIDKCGTSPLNPLFIRQPSHPANFLQYILEQARKESFDVAGYCFCHPRSLWDYSRSFSVLNAVSCGDEKRVLTLLKHGVDVLPELKIKKNRRRSFDRYQNLPRRFLMVFRMMTSIRSTNFLSLESVANPSNRHYIVSDEQKECFHIVWRSIPDAYVRRNELLVSLIIEYSIMSHLFVLNPVKYENMKKLCLMYEKNFLELASGPTQPRTLKHLCRCTIRNRLKKMWKLPQGIYELPLPVILHRYLNLETE